MTFGQRLKLLREETGMTQKDLGDKINVSKANISKYESGNIEANFDTLEKLSNLFDVSFDYLLGRTEIRNKVIDKLTPKDEKDIAKELNKTMEKLKNEQGLMFDGEPLDQETMKALEDALEMGMRYAKLANKKYTPKKYRKDN